MYCCWAIGMLPEKRVVIILLIYCTARRAATAAAFCRLITLNLDPQDVFGHVVSSPRLGAGCENHVAA